MNCASLSFHINRIRNQSMVMKMAAAAAGRTTPKSHNILLPQNLQPKPKPKPNNHHHHNHILKHTFLRLPHSSFYQNMSSQPTSSSSVPPSDDDSSSTPIKTVRVMIKGRVQGVFYRDWTVENAKGLGLKGWVRNQRDGSVEALFSGTADKVGEMQERCRRGPPSAMVTGLDVNPSTEDPGTEFERRSTV